MLESEITIYDKNYDVIWNGGNEVIQRETRAEIIAHAVAMFNALSPDVQGTIREITIDFEEV